MEIDELTSLLKIKESEKEKISKKLQNNVEETADVTIQLLKNNSRALEDRYQKLLKEFYNLTDKLTSIQIEVLDLTNQIKEYNE